MTVTILTDSELKIKVELDDLKPEEQNKQTGNCWQQSNREKVIKTFYHKLLWEVVVNSYNISVINLQRIISVHSCGINE